jgi:putative ABC transport system permease protein
MLSTIQSSGAKMARFRQLIRQLINVVRPGLEDASLERELASHLALLEDEYRRRGLSAAAARRAARLALGGVEQAKEQHRDARTIRWLDHVRRDAIYGVRMLRRRPLATVTAALSLAIGIGLNAAVFSVVDWVLLRPLPYPNAHQLVRVLTAGTAPVSGPSALIHDEFTRFAQATSLREAAVFTTTTRVMAGPGIDPAHVVIARVAGDLFATLAVYPEIGRTFAPTEMSSGARVVVLSHDLWQRRFSGDGGIAGRTILIDGAPHTVVGVMPSSRGYPSDAELWRPLTEEEREDNDRELNMVGRLRDDATVERASAEIATLANVASNGKRTAWADGVQRTDVGNVSTALQTLFAAAMLTLLIACANMAALMSARGADRAGEMVVRGALGATRGRVLGQLITESLVLAIAGGALGLLLGRWALTALVAMAPVSIPRLAEISLDSRIIGFGVVAMLLTGVAVGLVPALTLSRLSGVSGLTRVAWLRATPRSHGRRALVLAQIAIAVVLTTGATLLTRSLQHLVMLDHGFDADRLVAVDLTLRGTFDGDSRPLFRELIAQAETIPGVEAVSVSMRLPTQLTGLRAPVQIVGGAKLDSPATLRPVSQGYFESVGIPVTAGRGFLNTDSQRAPRVAIVNASFVRELLGGRPALDLRVTTPFSNEPVSIVGIAGDVTPAGESDRPAFYVPTDQLAIGSGYLIVRAKGDPLSIVPALTGRLRAAAPSLPADRVHRVAAGLEESRAVTRFSTQVAALFAALALLLSMIGVYGLTAGEVSARWRELAVRQALGASRRDALGTVVRPCAAILAGGAALGVIGALSVGPGLASLLHGVSSADGPTLLMVPVVLGAIGIGAALLAARRVVGVDPAETLRSE